MCYAVTLTFELWPVYLEIVVHRVSSGQSLCKIWTIPDDLL